MCSKKNKTTIKLFKMSSVRNLIARPFCSLRCNIDFKFYSIGKGRFNVLCKDCSGYFNLEIIILTLFFETDIRPPDRGFSRLVFDIIY